MKDEIFIRKVKEEMREIESEYGVSKNDSFAVWFAARILGEPTEKVATEYCIGGRADEKIDIGICDDEHELNYIIQCKYSSNPLETTYSRDLVDEVINAERRLREHPEWGNQRRQEFARLVLASDKPLRKIAVGFGRMDPTVWQYASEHDVELYDFEKIKDRYLYWLTPGAIRAPEVINLSCTHSPSVERKSDFKLYSFFTPLKDIYDAMKRYKDCLFEENLRYRLEKSSKTLVFDEIRKTILYSPEKFAALNNGITISAKKVEKSNSCIKLFSPQVINGCQTCWAIYVGGNDLSRQGSLDKLSNGTVLIKVLETDSPELIQKIQKASNFQNPIDARDLRAGDKLQRELHREFANWRKPILYEHKAGIFEQLERLGKIARFRISGKLYRNIDNIRCAQYILALLGRPGFAKARKKLIFQEDEIYNTVFGFSLPANERFNNSRIENLTAGEVKVRTGEVRYFIEDVIFAHAIYNLTAAVAKKYKEKLALFSEEEKARQDSIAYRLQENKRYLEYWHFHVISAMNYIVEHFARGDDDKRQRIRLALIGRDINLVWTPRKLPSFFNLNRDINSLVILDECKPSTKFSLFGKWINSLDHFMLEIAEQEKSSPDWKSWKDFDIRKETHDRFLRKIQEKLSTVEAERSRWFPLPRQLKG